MTNEVRIKPLIHQYEFLASDALHTIIVGGFRSGKSHAGALKTILKAIEGYNIVGQKSDVSYYLPTYDKIRRIAYPTFRKHLSTLNIEYELKETYKEIHTPYGMIIFRSMEEPTSIMGYEVHYSLIDELDRVHKNKIEIAFDNIIARNSLRTTNEYNSTDFVSTPEGYGFLYKFCSERRNDPLVKIIKASTENNPYIHKNYINTLKSKYTEAQLKAYLHGEFVNFNKQSVYPSFNRDLNTNVYNGEVRRPFAGMDFNVGKTSAVIGVDMPNGCVQIIKNYSNYEDTYSLGYKIKEDFGNIVIYPDASGKNRKTSGNTDHEVLRSIGHTVYTTSSNPRVRDRINEVNSRFRECKLFIDSACIELIEALEQQAYKENGEPEKDNIIDHAIDALGYLVCGKKGKISIFMLENITTAELFSLDVVSFKKYNDVLKWLNPLKYNAVDIVEMSFNEVSMIKKYADDITFENLQKIFELVFKMENYDFLKENVVNFYHKLNFVLKSIEKIRINENTAFSVNIDEKLKRAGIDRLNVFKEMNILIEIGERYNKSPEEIASWKYSLVFAIVWHNNTRNQIMEDYWTIKNK